MKFVVSFSAGKDSMLALHEMVEAGHEPAALLVMYRQEAGRSWVHGVDPELLAAIGEALAIPLIRCNANSDTYNGDMERGLRQARDLGAEACVFGDIDTPGHREWDEARCAAAGLKAVLPLWRRDRIGLSMPHQMRPPGYSARAMAGPAAERRSREADAGVGGGRLRRERRISHGCDRRPPVPPSGSH